MNARKQSVFFGVQNCKRYNEINTKLDVVIEQLGVLNEK